MPPGLTTDDLLRELIKVSREMSTVLERIASALDRQPGTGRLSRADEASLGALLPAIAAAVGHRTFAVSELIAHAQLEIAPAIALREALHAVGGAHKVGRILRRARNADIAGFRVVEQGASRDGMLRTVVTVRPERHSQPDG